jgi:hypothetical protein
MACLNHVIELDQKMLILKRIVTKSFFFYVMHLCGPAMLPGVEVFGPKIINIKQYVSTNNFSINNRHFVIKSSQTTQHYIIKVIYKHFSCHHHISN